jgi:hypothetical protein
MMKRLLAVLLMVSATWTQAQTFNDASNIARADLRVKKAELMTEAMRMDTAKSELFWPIYRAYESEIDGILERRLDLIRVYAGNYEIMTDDKASTLAKESFKIADDRLKIEEKYFKKMEKAIGGLAAVRFAQVDSRINTMLNMEIERTVPLIASREELGLPPKEEKK